MLNLIGQVIGIGGKVIEGVIEGREAQQYAKQRLIELAAAGELAAIEGQFKVIVAEASGQSWIQRSWRPVTMLTFVALIVAHWLGFTPDGLTEAEITGLLDIVQLGLGGYVVGRSAEKAIMAYKG